MLRRAEEPVADDGEHAAVPTYRLDALNFFLADVRGGLGPYLNVFLVTEQHWSQSEVGVVTAVGGWLGLLLQTPAGALIDATRAKRALIVAALVALAAGAVTIYGWPTFWPVLAANAVIGTVGDIFGPAVSAVTLGLVARRALARRLGRNSAFDHAGNAAIAAAAAAVGSAFDQRAVFLLVPVCAVFAVISTLSIPGRAIDHDAARGGEQKHAARGGEQAGKQAGGGSIRQVLGASRPLLIFGLCAALFHFANAPLLPLVGQKLARAEPRYATALMSACIIAAQGIMLPIALLVGASADRIGRRPILLAGFAVLPVRAALYTLSDDTWWLLGVQLLDGVGAGVFGAITPLVIADLMRGTGRFNIAQGAVATMQGLGAATSGLVTGEIVDRLGYGAGFLWSAAVAAVALLVLLLRMPETRADS